MTLAPDGGQAGTSSRRMCHRVRRPLVAPVGASRSNPARSYILTVPTNAALTGTRRPGSGSTGNASSAVAPWAAA